MAQPHSRTEGRVWAKSLGASTIRAAGIHVMASAHSGGYCWTLSSSRSKPTVQFSLMRDLIPAKTRRKRQPKVHELPELPVAEEAMSDLGLDWHDLRDYEVDAGLGVGVGTDDLRERGLDGGRGGARYGYLRGDSDEQRAE